MARPRLFLLSVLALLACDSAPAHPVTKPPPLPPFPVTSAKPAEEPAQPPAEATEHAQGQRSHGAHEKPAPAEKHARVAEPSKERPSAPKAAPATKAKTSEPAKPAAPSATPAPQPAPIVATTPKSEAASKVSVPKTVHLAIDFPAGLQADLNHDPRMQPWVNQVVATIDRCYASAAQGNASLAGTIEVLVTMHENERPDADIKQLPPALSPIVACATGGLMRTKMPLFTGKEGTRYPVKIRFSP